MNRRPATHVIRMAGIERKGEQMTTTTRAILIASLFACGVADAWAQTTTTPASSRPIGRASIFGMTSHTTDADGGSWSENALNLSFTLHPVENEDRPYDYGVDLRHSVYSGVGRP